MSAARRYLGCLSLQPFTGSGAGCFKSALDQHTRRLQRAFPPAARHWGTARKALNIFLRDALYNIYLSEAFHLHAVEQLLEIPLDAYTAHALRARVARLPRWRGVKHLTARDSAAYQEAARGLAAQMKVAPVHLDVIYRLEGTAGKR